MTTLWQDLRYALRTLVKNRAFTFTAVLTLALGIGANATIFSVVNAVLLQPLPYKDADRLAMVWHENHKLNDNRYAVSYLNFLDYKNQTESFAEMAGVSPVWNLTLREQGEAEQVNGYFVSASFFALLGVPPARGRVFTPEDDHAEAAPVVVLSHRLWQRRFGGDEGVINQNITFESGAATVIGVMPASFRFLDDVDLWLPLSRNPLLSRGRQIHFLTVFGSLKPGVAIDAASLEAATIAARMTQQYPESNADLGGRVVSLREDFVGKTEPALLVLLGAVGFLLLIACANIANLLLARATARRREIAVRLALGASRLRLIRQLLTESLLLAAIGGAGGLLLGVWGMDLVRAYSPEKLPGLETMRLDATVILFTFAVAALTGLLFGLVPALQSSKVSLQEALKDGAPTVAGHAGRWGRWFVIGEVALALTLLIGAGLLIRSFTQLLKVDAGFNPEGVLTFQIGVPQESYRDRQRLTNFYEQFFASLQSLPEVQAVGGVNRLPLRAGLTSIIEIEGRPVDASERLEVEFRRASDDYFRAMGIQVQQGRNFTAADRPHQQSLVILNERAARTFFPNEEALGKRLRFLPTNANTAPWMTVVGIVADVRHFNLEQEARPEIYLPFHSGAMYGPMFAVRTGAKDPAQLVPAIRQRLGELESLAPIYNIAAMPQLVSESVAARRFIMSLLGIFSGLAILLAAVGLYGVMSYTVAQRRREIGLRQALGASSRDLLLMIIRQGMSLVLIGIGVGLVGALALTRLMSSLLYGVSATDLLTFLTVPLLLAMVALAACFVPALRAAKTDPMVALRYE